MSTHVTTDVELSEAEFEEYIGVALANGFSKGTANVSPADMKRLRPLLNKYRKNPHPFRACVKDNRKRFGPNVNKFCAVIKDLIEGTTKWRGKKKGLSDSTLQELFGLDVDYSDVLLLSEITEEEVQEIMDGMDEDDSVEFAQGDVMWDPDEGLNALRRKIEEALNGGSSGPEDVGMSWWVEDVSKDKALVCERGKDFFVVPFSLTKGVVELAREEDWTPVTRAWVEEKVTLSDDPSLMAEMFFEDDESSSATKTKDGLIWKPILREGTWKFSPGGKGKPRARTLTVTKEGKSDGKNLVISMSELKKNFESGAVEHVTIPTSHADTVLENTGFIRKLKITTDDKGRAVLEAGMDFTEKEIKEKASNGTIANTSAGVLFDYIHKEKGKKYNGVLAHAALTNRPWINGLKPFGVNASEELEIVHFSEESIDDPATVGGGDNSMSETTFDLSEYGFDNEESFKTFLAEAKASKEKEREREVADKCKAWQDEGKSPALVAEARAVMMSDQGASVLNLSEDGKSVALTASDIVERLVNKSNSVKLDEEVVTDQDASGEKPEDKPAELSQEEKLLANQIFLSEGLSYKDAVEKAKSQLNSKNE